MAYPRFQKDAWLAALRECGVPRAASKAVGCDMTTPYQYRKDHPEFAVEWQEAERDWADTLETEAARRARDGVSKPLYHQGQPVYLTRTTLGEDGKPRVELVLNENGEAIQATELVYSDRLLQKMLEGNRPLKYASNTNVKLSGPDGGAVKVESDFDVARRLAFVLAKGMIAAENPESDGSYLV